MNPNNDENQYTVAFAVYPAKASTTQTPPQLHEVNLFSGRVYRSGMKLNPDEILTLADAKIEATKIKAMLEIQPYQFNYGVIPIALLETSFKHLRRHELLEIVDVVKSAM